VFFFFAQYPVANPQCTGSGLYQTWCWALSNLGFSFFFFAQYPVANSSSLVLGSIKPWVESILLMHEAALPITTVDFNPPISEVKELRTLSVEQLVV
jgi:hypothetical protein